MLERGLSYDALRAAGLGDVPKLLNMAAQVCDDWVDRNADRLAIIDLSEGPRKDITYSDLQKLSWQVQAELVARGVRSGDRVGVLLGQSPLCAAAHIAAWRMGAISVPLFKLFRHDALASRIANSGMQAVVSDEEGAKMLATFDLDIVLRSDLSDPVPQPSVQTNANDPAIIIYTSGTTGKPKGALHAHRMLSGHLPGVEISHDFLGLEGDVLWTPADWAWIGGLFDVLMPGLALGVPVVAARMARFNVEECINIVEQTSVKNVFFPPTALRMLRSESAQIDGLRSVASGGEPLGAEMLAWGRKSLGVEINEFYGQTECNMVASSCGALFTARPGAIGKAVPGFDVAVIDEDGVETDGEGDIAVRCGAPSMLLEYWNNPTETARKFRGDWLVMGDRGVIEDGFLRFVGRDDDVITSGGYRIGPSEIEDCLLTHSGVVTVGVVGKPDPLRTEIVKAYVVQKQGVNLSEIDLQTWVKDRLASYSYPREITFVDELPMTVTGKVIRKELKARATAEAKIDISKEQEAT
ncbi:AMP-binding protein [Pelagimonas varians]|uniref:Acetyl-coenzyme A synthetase n=1 Tax=Pelagimonas varians TaxID=696760 RepID=A0A238JRH1_9RHOB|nr:AMP-binding protein [Pelagimonas varians]PYG34615.1 acetyl-CoA synthetase [Pelagimonas varians]SMX33250.1 Acetyl-coenzyme A synthetase [Pelagimonas varians]